MDDDTVLCNFLLGNDIIQYCGTIENLIQMIMRSNLPNDLLLIKLFQYVMWKGKTIDEFYAMLAGDAELNFETLDKDTKEINKFMDIIKTHNIEFNAIEDDVAIKNKDIFTNELTKINKTNIDVKHKGIPEVDPVEGRPHLFWKICKHSGCGAKFKNPLGLVNHLIKCNVYTQGYHYYHERAVEILKLTPESVLKNNLTKCPSYVCNSKEFSKAENLITHFTNLGISPFWQVGMICKNELKEDNRSLLYTVPKLFNVDTCIICLSNAPQIITGGCRHHVYCIDCYKEFNKTTHIGHLCPMCKRKVDVYYPFVL